MSKVFLILFFCSPCTYAILAGGEFDLPADSPSGRIDTEGIYSFVGSLEIASGGYNYYGSASALSPHWVLTAGHNVDFNDDGQVDGGLSVDLHLPGFGSYSASTFAIHPDFTGFGNPSIHHDLSLLYFDDPGSADGLGNDIETLIGPGDSGGALLVGNALVGVNTFTEGYGGLFGDIGGGIALNNEWGWIHETTGLAIPEPSSILLLVLGGCGLAFCRRTGKFPLILMSERGRKARLRDRQQ